MSGKIIYPQSAVIPFKIQNNRFRLLVITSLKSKQWIFPKGIIEDHLTPQQSARKEALEEAGIEGEVINFSLGEYSYLKWGGLCEVVVFPMYVTRVLEEWPEANVRERKWVSIEQASNLILKEELKNILERFKENIENIKSKVISPS
jgi:8-oxo-dGTP pyrophosphatase MutT (NUDIX family)